MLKFALVFASCLLLLGAVAFLPPPSATRNGAGTTLHNGIVLPDPWPPKRRPNQRRKTPPYLLQPPEVIPIDVGRQLFVDDFLIESTTLERRAHRPVLHADNPVIEARTAPDTEAFAAPQSDGVWYDDRTKSFRAWYWGGASDGLAYAYSADGENWVRPSLEDPVIPDFPHMVIRAGGGRASGTTWIDHAAGDPRERYKAFIYTGGRKQSVWFSGDGVDWRRQEFEIESVSDRTTFFYNPFRKIWAESARAKRTLPTGAGRPERVSRARVYRESADLKSWVPPDTDPTAVFWTGPDQDDPPYPGAEAFPELYNLDAVAYESLLVGLFTWYYPDEDANLLEIGVGFSRDGFHWTRPTRGGGPDAFIPAANRPDAWDAYNTQSAGGGFLVVGDELWFYFSGRDKRHGTPLEDWTVSTGLAKLRRDGFYSMDADAAEGTLTTRPIRFSGAHLFVNARTDKGEMRVEVLDLDGAPLPGFSRADAVPVVADDVRSRVRWADREDLSELAGRPVRLRFHLRSGSIYSFWVSPDDHGASHGYVAAGGPGFVGGIDDGAALTTP